MSEDAPEIPKEEVVADGGETVEAAEIAAPVAVEIRANEDETKEETPVFDVHMPHETHTWKDFWIHLGTITVGLLIAIGLEQGVEKLHHLEQGRQLTAD